MPASGTEPAKKARAASNFDWAKVVLNGALPLAGVVAALAVAGIFLALLKTDPLTAYAAMLNGALGSTFGLTMTLVKATPLLLVGLGICIAFRANVINIGAEGQIIMGALAGAVVPISMPNAPGWFLIAAACVAGFASGALWGFIPGILKAKMRVNEILSTIMMNAIALQFMNFLLQGPLMDPENVKRGTFLAQSARIPQQAWLPRLVPQTLLHAGLILAIVLAIVVYIFLWRTTIGYEIRAVGLSPDASRYSGISVPFNVALSLTLAGGFAGLAGVVEVIGVQHRLMDGLTSGYGFTGIVAALLGGLHPLGLIPASIFFGGLLVGADKMQRAVQIPSALVTAILGMIVLLVSGAGIWARKWSAKRLAGGSRTAGGERAAGGERSAEANV